MQIPDLTPVERFVREVVPTIPGGLQRVTNVTGHLALIQAAAADRGLTTRTIDTTTYFFDGRWPVGGMTGWVPTLVGREAHAISHAKDATKRMLEAAGVPTPVGITVGPDGLDEALAHVRRAERTQVLKPTRGYAGSGITCGIASESDLRTAWTTARAAGPSPAFVLEEQVAGVDIRAYVVGPRVVAAVTRVNAHVVGDGASSLAALIAEKQRRRDEHNARLAKHPIIVDTDLLARCGRTLQDIPLRGDVIVLNSVANNHVGGESVDVTDLAHPDLFRLAVDAARAIPGLGVAGVDLMTPDLGSADRAVVLEVNVGANVRVHLCPAYGKPRDVAAAIVEEMIATAIQETRADRSSSRATARQDPTPATDPVDRFVREVLPTVPGGSRRMPSTARSHGRLIMRAAKARGLTTVPLGDVTYFYAGRVAVGGLHKRRTTTLVGRNALDACDTAAVTRQLLQAAGVPTPEGVILEADRFDQAAAVLPTLGASVLKTSRGRGVTRGITTVDDLAGAWEAEVRALTAKSRLLVLEQQIVGVDVRVFVVGGHAVAATAVLPPVVGGDGRRDDDGSNAHAHHHVDITTILHPGLLDLAVDATRAVPGLRVAGVDLIVPDPHVVDGAVVVGLDAAADIGPHHHPARGKPRDVAGAIIEEMIESARRLGPTVRASRSRRPPRSRFPWTRGVRVLPVQRR